MIKKYLLDTFKDVADNKWGKEKTILIITSFLIGGGLFGELTAILVPDNPNVENENNKEEK